MPIYQAHRPAPRQTSDALTVAAAMSASNAYTGSVQAAPGYWIAAIMILMGLALAMRPRIDQAALRWRRIVFPATEPSCARVVTYPQNGATFLQSFDQLEDILHDALTLHIGPGADACSLREKILLLEHSGFLTPEDRNDWSRCLTARNRILFSGTDFPPPPNEATRARMGHLQARLLRRLSGGTGIL
jgi:hypothetical protein